ncbi:MAG: TonB-dependent hemoglobin/transferrin/lactoferrin family receptor [Xanthomonadales bacterium]|nr:TonB-dependent hemoglobin/transferrin/lactoferrin family receptor [Xanthomonadales bacterium]
MSIRIVLILAGCLAVPAKTAAGTEAGAALPSAAIAEQAAPSAERPDTPLDTVVVVASRASEPISQVVASVSRVERDDIERQLVQDLDGLVRYTPGIGVVSDANRFGNRGFSIRGLEGNRVRILVDGVPVADGFSVGQFAAAGRDLVELEAVDRVEVQRGPASTLYGSDALAGVVAFRTRDPGDFLARVDGGTYLGGRLGWSGIDDSVLASATWAAASPDGRWEAMALYGRREGEAAGNRAWRERDRPNPADWRRQAMLAKAVHDGGDAGRYTLTVDAGREDRDTDVRSLTFGPGRFATTYRLLADDGNRRSRLSLAGAWQPGLAWLDQLDGQVYGQRSRTVQDSLQWRLPDAATPFESLRFRRFEYDTRATGLGLVGQARAEGDRVSHWHVFGLDAVRQRHEGLRDGLETNLASGATSTVVLGERFPVRDFPTSTSDTLALFWQDEIALGRRFALIPGLRAEVYRLRADPDAIFREDYPDLEPVDVDEARLTPRLAARWSPGGGHSLFVQYARGFRAPPFGDVNIGLSLPTFNYEVRPNPDLRPERSAGLELGWRHVGRHLRASVSVYENRYRDLIESRANLGVDPVSGALVFQSVNRDRARIRGAEGELLWRLAGLSGRLDGFELRVAAAWAEGDDTRRDRPLNSIEPGRLATGLRWDHGSGLFGAEWAVVASQRKRRLDPGAGPAPFAPPGWVRHDLYAWLQAGRHARLNLGLTNLGDRRYWEWGGVRGLAANAPDLGFYTRPGRAVSATLAVEW